ncbi:protein SPMIP7-like isoform X1 [Branchiostoma floridae x Branchiostoma japonicum]
MTESGLRPRPELDRLVMPDPNAGGNTVQQIELARRLRHSKFPTLKGRADVDSFQELRSAANQQWNPNAAAPHGGYPAAPMRDNIPILEPCSMFVSPAAEVDRLTVLPPVGQPWEADIQGDEFEDWINYYGRTQMPSMVQHEIRPNTAKPASVPPPSRNVVDTLPKSAPAGSWNARSIPDVSIRARLGGWTSQSRVTKGAPREPENLQTHNFWFEENRPPTLDADANDRGWRDQAARKYMYTSSQQSAYETVDWDKKLPEKVRPPTGTLELQPDQISYNMTHKRYMPRAEEWQRLGRAWDWFQHRDNYTPARPVTFMSHSKKVNHIPYYDGHLPGYGDKDYPDTGYQPITVLRLSKPRYTDTAHRPNIPGYAGCVHWLATHPAHAPPKQGKPEMPTTAREHRRMPYSPNDSEHKHMSTMSNMVTTVPPFNPFNKVERQDIDITKLPTAVSAY